jgi:hypothetical protein
MSKLDFHLEFTTKVPHLRDQLLPETDERLQALREGHTDLIGAAITIEELTQNETPHLYRARVVVYIRPKNISGEEKAENPNLALKGALDAVERQVNERRAKLSQPWQQPEHVTDLGVYELTAEEIYDTFAPRLAAPELLETSRTELATTLIVEHNFEESAAFYAADQILFFAEEIVADRQPEEESNDF